MISRKVQEAQKNLIDGNWSGWGPSETMGERVKGKKVGIIGMGRIGKAVAKRLNMLGMKINYHNRKRLPRGVEKKFNANYYSKLNSMLEVCDVISIHCPYTPETFHLLSKKRLKMLKKHCVVINTSRGEIVDEQALAELLNKKKIGGAGLDVFEHEPQVSQKLLDSKSVVLLPHISSATKESRMDMGERVIKNIDTFLSGKHPPDLIKKNIFD
jgi:glyoxylate reductase